MSRGFHGGSAYYQTFPGSVEPFTPPCECKTCTRMEWRSKLMQESFPYGGIVDERTAPQLIAGIGQQLKEYQHLLQMLIETNGRKITKRWRRKNTKQRNDLLTEYCPNLCPQDHAEMRSNLDLHGNARTKSWKEDTTESDTMMLPYLNFETLTADNLRLLACMHHRAWTLVWQFSQVDSRQMMLGWDAGNIAEKVVPGCVVMHGASYPTWKKDIDISRIHRGEEATAHKALLVMQAQVKLFAFLTGLAAHLAQLKNIIRPLGSAGPTTESADQVRALKDEVEKTLSGIEETDQVANKEALASFVSQSMMSRAQLSIRAVVDKHENLPFFAPPEFSIETLITLVSDRLLEMEDEIWLLQTDPRHLARHLRRVQQRHVSKSPTSESLTIRERVLLVNFGMWVPVLRNGEWHTLLEELRNVRHISTKWASFLKPGYSLFIPHEKALQSAYHVAKSLQQKFNEVLVTRIMTFPELWPVARMAQIDAQPQSTAESRAEARELSPTVRKLLQKNPFLYLVFNFMKWDLDRPHSNLAFALRYLDLAIESVSRAESACIDPEMMALLSDMAVLEEIVTALELHQPNFVINPVGHEIRYNPRPHWYRQRAIEYNNVSDYQPRRMLLVASRLVCPFEKLSMPQGVRTEAWILKWQEAQDALFQAWREVDEGVESLLETELYEGELAMPFRQALQYYKEPSHLRKIKAERQQLRAANELNRLSALRLGSSSTYDAVEVKQQKSKAKTRGQGREEQVVIFDEIQNEPQAETPPPTVLYKLAQQHFNIVALMFPSAALDTQGTCSFREFAATMTQLGFGLQGLGGSARRFRGEILVVLEDGSAVRQHRSIVCHEPHPDPEMGSEMLQAIGKRCAKHFGWCRENFVEV